MRASVVIVRSVFSGDHQAFTVHKRCRIRKLAPKTDLPYIAVLNGAPVLRKDWGRSLKDGDALAFVVHPGKGGGSNPLSVVLSIALSIAAPGLGNMLALEMGLGTGATAGTLLGFTASEALGAAIGFIGKAAINAMMGTSPSQPSTHQARSFAAPSPTYSIGAQGNQARLGQAIPEIFGRHLVYPDMAAAPYTEFNGDDQTLYQLFCIGRGEYDLDAIRIGETSIESFSEVEYEVIPPGGSVTLFPSNVLTSAEVSGQEIFPQDTINLSSTALSFDAGNKRIVASSGTPFSGLITNAAGNYHWVRVSGAANAANNGVFRVTSHSSGWMKVLNTDMVDEAEGATVVITGAVAGPYVVTPPGVTTNRIGIDVIAPKGLFYANDDGGLDKRNIKYRLQLRAIDDNGAPLGTGEWWSPPIQDASTKSLAVTDSFIGDDSRTDFSLTRGVVDAGTLSVSVDGKKLTDGWTLTQGTVNSNGSMQTPAHVVFASAPRQPKSITSTVQVPVSSGTISYTQPKTVTSTPKNVIIKYLESTTETSEVMSGATTTPKRRTLTYDVPNARYEARMVRSSAKQVNSRAAHDLIWGALRAYLPDTTSYDDVTLLAVKMRATNNLTSQSSRLFNCVVTRKLPIWNGSAWSAPVATQSIAWALAYLCRTRLTDDRYDLAWLQAQDAIWAARGDTFNAVFDSEIVLGEALTLVARAGRARWYQHGMVYRFFRDEPKALPTAVFNTRNTIKDSFRTDYILSNQDTADSIEVEFFNEATWKPDYVTCTLPGSTNDRPARIRLFGVTNREQAWREGMYEAAANRYRRVLPSLTTDMEGFIPLPGNLVALQRNIAGWGKAGDLLAYSDTTRIIQTTEPLTFGAGTHYMAFKRRDGSFDGPYTVTAGVDANHAVLATTLDFTPDLGLDRERTSYVFGPADDFYMPARVIGMRPRGMTQVELSFVVEDDAVHTADTGPVPPESARWDLPITVEQPVVSDIAVVLGGTIGSPLLLASWRQAPNASHYVIEQSLDAGESWSTGITSHANNVTLPAHKGTISLRVTAIGIAGGLPVIWSGDPSAVSPPDVTSLVWSISGTRLTLAWDTLSTGAQYAAEVRIVDVGMTWDDATLLTRVSAANAVVDVQTGTHDYLVKLVNVLGSSYSETEARVTVAVGLPADVDIFTVESAAAGLSRFRMQFVGGQPEHFAGFRLRAIAGRWRDWGNGIPLHDGLIGSYIYETNAVRAGTWIVMVKAVDIYGQESANAAYVVFGLGDTLEQNLIDTYDFRTAGWTGTLVDGAIDGGSGDVLATDTTALMWADAAMWGADASLIWGAGSAMLFTAEQAAMWVAGHENWLMFTSTFPAMVYETSYFANEYGLMWLTSDGDGSYQIEVRDPYPDAMWPLDTDPMWDDDAALAWRYNANYVPYTQRIQAQRQSYDIRVRWASGTVRGRLRQFKAMIDAEDIIEKFNDVAIAPGGTRLPITKSYRKIVNVKLTLQDNGGTAVGARIVDKSANLGPLTQCLDVSGSSAAGLVDAEIQGY